MFLYRSLPKFPFTVIMNTVESTLTNIVFIKSSKVLKKLKQLTADTNGNYTKYH